jgi:glycosyltransferase involved in cell wall biosynthesis
VDVVHHTYYGARFLRASPGAAKVTTVHDMIPELFAGSEHFTATHLEKRRYVELCDLVICVSESTRRDMVSLYGDIAHKVRVIPNAVDPGFGPRHDPLPGLPAEYVLYVGAREGYKDFGLLPRALEALAREGLEIPLVVVGKPLTSGESRDLSQRGLFKSTYVRQLNDADLKRVYAHCSALVQTSRYEGFGLTPLEGMASGIPVVVARASSMPEVGGDVAQYFIPDDPVDLARVMVETLSDQALRRDLGVRGPLRAAEFSSYEMARKTAEAYASLAAG